MPLLTIRLTPTERAQAHAQARAQGRTLSAHLRHLLGLPPAAPRGPAPKRGRPIAGTAHRVDPDGSVYVEVKGTRPPTPTDAITSLRESRRILEEARNRLHAIEPADP